MPAKIYEPIMESLKKDQSKQVFSKILEQGRVRNIIPSLEAESMNWFKAQAQQQVSVMPEQLLKDKSRVVRANNLRIGSMYLFAYDPKYKRELPYYDRFPLVIPFNSKSTANVLARNNGGAGFMGMNFHYLNPMYRAMLFDGLLNISRIKTLDENARMRASYSMMNSASKNVQFFKPCIKQYLLSHVIQGKFLYIRPEEWPIAMFLPLQRFVKVPTASVWQDSIDQIKGGTTRKPRSAGYAGKVKTKKVRK